MSRKQSPIFGAQPLPAISSDGVEKALAAGRFEQAAEMARRLHAQQADTKSLALLHNAIMALGRFLAQAERWRELIALANEAERLTSDDQPAWIEQAAELRVLSGDLNGGLKMLARIPGSTAGLKLAGIAVDRAIVAGKSARDLLPAEFHAGFDAVNNAFALYEKGSEGPAREALQSIGLQSPFLEWKLLLRGLLSYSAKDDARALENWQRLSPDRVPAQLAAPLRAALDNTYRRSHPAAAHMQVQVDILFGDLLGPLRKLQRMLGSDQTLPQALDRVGSLAAEVKRLSPSAHARLANLIYWAIAHGGAPEDVNRYRKIFGHHPDDPESHRLYALVHQGNSNLEEAHKQWHLFEQAIARHPERWPSGQADRARALVLVRMGEIAEQHMQEEDVPDFMRFFFQVPGMGGMPGMGGPKKPLKPSSEEIYRRAAELAPTWQTPQIKLFEMYMEDEKLEKAEQVAQQMLERFPHDLPTLLNCAQLYEQQNKIEEALGCLREAVLANPLDKDLRRRLGFLQIARGRMLAEKKNFEQARAMLKEAVAGEEGLLPTVRCCLAAVEFKAGKKEEAFRIAAEACPAPERKLAIDFQLMVETLRVKAPKPIQQQYRSAFEAAIEEEPPLANLVYLVAAMGFYLLEEVAYRGRKGHEKMISSLVQKALQKGGELPQLVRLGMALMSVKWLTLLKTLANVGRRQFPEDPHFPFFEAHAMISRNPEFFSFPRASHLLSMAWTKVKDSTDPEYQFLRSTIEEMIKEMPELGRWIQDQEEDDYEEDEEYDDDEEDYESGW